MDFARSHPTVEDRRLYPMIKIKALTRKNWASYSAALQELESFAEYPYGSDHFKISHGDSYFSFFERLGEPLFHVALDGTKVVACASGVLRSIPTENGVVESWYLCDLKVHPKYRDRRIPSLLFRKRIFLNYLRCGRAYAVSMNPNERFNRVVEITKRFPYFPITQVGELNIFSLDFDQVNHISTSLNQIIGPISFLSLAGKKDLLMKSTHQTMPLLHIQHGPLAESQISVPQENFVHMICSSKNSVLDQALRSKFSVSATASVLAHRMMGMNWDFILTSDI